MLKNLVLVGIGIFYSIQVLSMEKEIILETDRNTESKENILSIETLVELILESNLSETEKDVLYYSVLERLLNEEEREELKIERNKTKEKIFSPQKRMKKKRRLESKENILSSKNNNVLIELLQNADLPQQEKDILFYVTKDKYATAIALLLERKALVPSVQNDILIWAAENGDAALMGILLQYGEADPSVQDNKAIRSAAKNGHTAVVGLLLKDGRVAPEAVKNKAFRLAVKNGHTSVVGLLLKDKRVHPGEEDDEALHWAAHYGFLAILQILLNDKRVSTADSDAIYWAAHEGHIGAVRLLLQHGDINPSAYFKAIRFCSEKKDQTFKFIFRLLTNITVCNKVLQKAAESYQIDIVEELLQDGKITSANNSEAIGQAICAAGKNGFVKIVELLLKKSADYVASYSAALRAALRQNNLKPIAFLLRETFIPRDDALPDEMEYTIERTQVILDTEYTEEEKLTLIKELFPTKEEVKRKYYTKKLIFST